MSNKETITLSELINEGKRIARLVDNRDFDSKDLKAKKASLKEKGQLIPAIIVDGSKAVSEGLDIVDFKTSNPINDDDAANYVVIIEGNHRYKAHLELLEENETANEKYEREFYVMYPLNDSDTITIDSMFKEMNIATNPWKSKDYLKEVARKTEEYTLLKEINALVSEGYSIPSASMWLTLGKPIDPTTIKKLSAGKKLTTIAKNSLSITSNIATGKELLKLSKAAFGLEFVKTRTLSTWVTGKIENGGVTNANDTINRIKKMLSNLATDNNAATAIINAKGVKGGETKDSKIYRLLDKQFENTQQSEMAE